ncbi:MAG: hemerythrin domain-containing protein [Elusimicrobia bacterium]|nr:hemerythrin domain-containing protein [Elusimicrobiota bacterium]
MTIIQQLTDDHAFFKETFAELDALSSEPALEETILRASDLVQHFRDRHRVHLHRESSVLFPTLLGYLEQGKTNMTRAAIFHHLQEEHLDVGRKIYMLEQDLVSRPLNPSWLTSFRDLSDAMVPHMQNEDEHLFPEAARLMPQEQLKSMAVSEFFPSF